MRANQINRDIPRPRGEQAPRRPKVLVATTFDEASCVALRRGQAIASALGAELVVVHAVPALRWIHMLFPQRHVQDVIAARHLIFQVAGTARSWCEEVLGADAPKPALILKKGNAAPAIIEAARSVRASMIILGSSSADGRGSSFGAGVAASVIQRARRPVMVARAERTNREIVAATNFVDASYPALRLAARLGKRLGAPVTFVHNLSPSHYIGAASYFGIPVPPTVVSTEPQLERRQHDLDDVARSIGPNIETLVATEDGPAEAILDLARARDADLVVVGTRRRRGLMDRLSLGTAARVAREARRSVLAVPLRAEDLARPS